jgi:hypothetical protein
LFFLYLEQPFFLFNVSFFRLCLLVFFFWKDLLNYSYLLKFLCCSIFSWLLFVCLSFCLLFVSFLFWVEFAGKWQELSKNSRFWTVRIFDVFSCQVGIEVIFLKLRVGSRGANSFFFFFQNLFIWKWQAIDPPWIKFI